MRQARGRSGIALPLVVLSISAVLAGCGSPEPAPWNEGVAAPAPAPTPTPTPVESAPTGTSAPSPTATATTSASPTPTASRSRARRPRQAASSPKPEQAPVGMSRYVFPVSGRNVSYHPTHSAYPATDIFADCGAPVVAVMDGTILEASRVDRYRKDGPQGPFNGGLSVSMLGADGVRYYGSHLTVVNTGIEAGVRVRAGQRLGTVGKTGNANNVCHLHFGISPPCARTGDWKVRRGVVWPASFLDSWRQGGRRSPASKVAAWKQQNGCTA